MKAIVSGGDREVRHGHWTVILSDLLGVPECDGFFSETFWRTAELFYSANEAIDRFESENEVSSLLKAAFAGSGRVARYVVDTRIQAADDQEYDSWIDVWWKLDLRDGALWLVPYGCSCRYHDHGAVMDDPRFLSSLGIVPIDTGHRLAIKRVALTVATSNPIKAVALGAS